MKRGGNRAERVVVNMQRSDAGVALKWPLSLCSVAQLSGHTRGLQTGVGSLIVAMRHDAE